MGSEKKPKKHEKNALKLARNDSMHYLCIRNRERD